MDADKILKRIFLYIILVCISFLLVPLIVSYFYYGPNGPLIISDYGINLLIGTKNSNYIQVDDSGIPFVNYGVVGGKFLGEQRNPVTVSQKIFEYYNDFKHTENDASKIFLINNANWLVDNAQRKNDYAILYYHFPWPIYDLPSPWRSGMAQGQGIQALIYAHEITNDEKYLDTAKLLLKSFFIEVKDGGVTYKSIDDGFWYEEYAHEDGKVSRVLNGMMFSVLGIYSYYNYTNDTESKFLFDQGIVALKNEIPNYDVNGYSYYDLLGNYASKKYHQAHINLTEELYDISKEEIFKFYHEKWSDV